MPSAPSYSPSDILLFTHVMDQSALEAGGLDEAMRAKVGLRITMGAAAGLSGVSELVAFAREALC
jgi:phosphoserine aminotransferase